MVPPFQHPHREMGESGTPRCPAKHQLSWAVFSFFLRASAWFHVAFTRLLLVWKSWPVCRWFAYRLVISLVALVYQRGYLLQFPRCETASKQFFWQTLPTGGQVHVVTEMWDQLVVPWEGDHDLIHDLRHRKYAVNFELQIRRKSVQELLQIDYGVPLEVPWQPKGRFPKSDVWFLGWRCFKTLRYLEISSGFTCWTRKLTIHIHQYLSMYIFISI